MAMGVSDKRDISRFLEVSLFPTSLSVPAGDNLTLVAVRAAVVAAAAGHPSDAGIGVGSCGTVRAGEGMQLETEQMVRENVTMSGAKFS